MKISNLITITLFISISFCVIPQNKTAKYKTGPVKKTMANEVKFDEPVTDVDGNEYKTIKIGTQIWMAENLKVIHYQNGEAIPNITNHNEWVNCINGAWCDYKNESKIGAKYGKLYNWYAVNDRRSIAPKNWHVPTYEEWLALANCLGGSSIAVGKLKSKLFWYYPSVGTTNISGFSALPGGSRIENAEFDMIGYSGYWWSSTDNGEFHGGGVDIANSVRLSPDHFKFRGYSVRCVKDTQVAEDNGESINENEKQSAKIDANLEVLGSSPFIVNGIESVYQNEFFYNGANYSYGYKGKLNPGEYTLITKSSVTKFSVKDNAIQRIIINEKQDPQKQETSEIIEQNGNTIEGKKYDEINVFDKGKYLTVKSNNMYGCIDLMGNEVLPVTLKCKSVGSFSDSGFAPVIINYNEEFGKPHNFSIINLLGYEIKSNLNFRYMNKFSEGLSWVVLDDKMGCVNEAGEIVIPIIYDQQSCGEGVWCDDKFINGTKVVLKNDKYGLIDLKGNEIIPIEYESLEEFSPQIFKCKLNKKFGLVDIQGREILKCEFNFIGNLSENRACIKNDVNFGYINGIGKLIIPFQFEFFEDTKQWLHYGDCPFVNGNARVKLNGLFGTIDRTGKFTQGN